MKEEVEEGRREKKKDVFLPSSISSDRVPSEVLFDVFNRKRRRFAV